MKLTQERNDVLPEGRAPRNMRRFLLRLGGTNPYGEPNYRLVRAEHVLIYLGNNWTDWPKGTPIEEQDGLVFSEEKVAQAIVSKLQSTGAALKQIVEMPAGMLPSTTRPLRRVKEMRWVKRYPALAGWMLQRWDPPAFYGSREWWEAQRVPGAEELMVLGPFPERGRYEDCTIFTTIENGEIQLHQCLLHEIPPHSKLEEALQDQERKKVERFRSPDSEWNRLIAITERQQIEEAERKKYREYCTLRYRDKLRTIMSTSLAGGRIREALARRAGMTSHVGN